VSEKALSYMRVSARSQIEGDGFPRQTDTIRQYARQHDIEIVGEFKDEGISGTTGIEQRPGLLALFARIGRNGVSVVLVERPDRLARELIEGELILQQLRRLRIRVIECEGGNDLTAANNASATLVRQVFGAVAQYDKACIVAKLAAARRRKREKDGHCEGRKPYGAKPGEEGVVERVVELRKAGTTIKGIAAILQAEHRPTRHGGQWAASSVMQIVRREGLRLREQERATE
jgi:DNA invertase Pin-like site-specific DNA recombinase